MTLPSTDLKVARSRNAAATRAAILEAARLRFGREGYDEVGIRDLARDVGVDAAMVCRYFGSKEDLLAEALNACGDGGRRLMEVDRADFGRQTAHNLVYEAQSCEKLQGLLIMLRASASAKAAEIVERAIAQDFIAPFSAWLGGEEAEVRARLASSVIMGVALSRTLSGGFPSSEADKKATFERLAAILQHCVDG